MGTGAPWESDMAAQESNSPGRPGPGSVPRSAQMRRGPQGAGASQPRSGSWNFRRLESYWRLLHTTIHASPFVTSGVASPHLTLSPSCHKRRPNMGEKGRCMGWGFRRRAVQSEGLAGGEGFGQGEHEWVSRWMSRANSQGGGKSQHLRSGNKARFCFLHSFAHLFNKSVVSPYN